MILLPCETATLDPGSTRVELTFAGPCENGTSLKQYMPKKPVQREFKVWMRAEAVNGYVSGFEVYTGKKSDSVRKGLGAIVVKTLSDDMHHTHRHLYFDNFLPVSTFCLISFVLGFMGAAHSVQTIEDS